MVVRARTRQGLNLTSDAVLQIWNEPASLSRILRAGYRAISSPAEVWYLDCGWDWLNGGDASWCGFNGWATVYLHEPLPADIDPADPAAALLIGGETPLWGEAIDSTSIDGVLWPRAAAAAERLWSARDVRDKDEAVFRLERQRDRLVARGIRSGHIRYKWCTLNPNSCV